MILDKKDLVKLSDDEYFKLVRPFDRKVKKHISQNIINQFVAFYIATGFEMDSICNDKFYLLVERAVIELAQVGFDSCSIKKIKSILKKEYGLKVTADDPTEIIDINIKNKRK